MKILYETPQIDIVELVLTNIITDSTNGMVNDPEDPIGDKVVDTHPDPFA